MEVGFIGLGNMGYGMAHNLLRAGHQLVVFNRTRSRAEPLAAEGATIADSPRSAASAGVVITMLADDQAVEEVVFGGLLDALPPAGLHISMSTISVALSERLAQVHEKQRQQYVAAPVFGRPEAAEAAKLFIIAAGSPGQIERAKPLFEAMGQRTFFTGAKPANANVVKLSGNFLIACMIEGVGEALALVRKYGIDPHEYLEILTTTLFPAPLYKNYGSLIVQQKFEPAGFRLRLGFKDVRLALAAAEAQAVPMPFGSLLHDHLLSGIARGLENVDWSALARLVAEDAGLK